jgi:hypothetical protein
VYPCGDVKTLKQILAKALADLEHLREMGQAARQRLESWSPRENVESTVDAIVTAVSRLQPNIAPEGTGLGAPRHLSE